LVLSADGTALSATLLTPLRRAASAFSTPKPWIFLTKFRSNAIRRR
jgi:hypothetical protein